jgi:hypothetical protein
MARETRHSRGYNSNKSIRRARLEHIESKTGHLDKDLPPSMREKLKPKAPALKRKFKDGTLSSHMARMNERRKSGRLHLLENRGFDEK